MDDRYSAIQYTPGMSGIEADGAQRRERAGFSIQFGYASSRAASPFAFSNFTAFRSNVTKVSPP